MDRGAWRAIIHRVAELDTTEATQHACIHIHCRNMKMKDLKSQPASEHRFWRGTQVFYYLYKKIFFGGGGGSGYQIKAEHLLVFFWKESTCSSRNPGLCKETKTWDQPYYCDGSVPLREESRRGPGSGEWEVTFVLAHTERFQREIERTMESFLCKVWF